MRKFLPLLGALLIGCAVGQGSLYGLTFQEFSGTQKNWPTSTKTFVTRSKGIIIYHGPEADRPYVVIGDLVGVLKSSTDEDKEIAQGVIAHGGEAALIIAMRASEGILGLRARIIRFTPSAEEFLNAPDPNK